MKTNLFKYILMGSLAMSGAYAGSCDTAGDVSARYPSYDKPTIGEENIPGSGDGMTKYDEKKKYSDKFGEDNTGSIDSKDDEVL